jgi:hypothetical protein
VKSKITGPIDIILLKVKFNRNEINCTSWVSRKMSVELADTSEMLYALAADFIQMIMFKEFALFSALFWFRFF